MGKANGYGLKRNGSPTHTKHGHENKNMSKWRVTAEWKSLTHTSQTLSKSSETAQPGGLYTNNHVKQCVCFLF